MYVKSARLFGAPIASSTASASSNTDQQSLLSESGGGGGFDSQDEMPRPYTKLQNQYILENTMHDDRKERIRLFVTYLTLTITLILLLIILIATYLWYKKRSSFQSLNGSRRNATNASRTQQELEALQIDSNNTTNNPKTRLNNRRVTIIDSKMDEQDEDCSRKLLEK